MKQHDLNIVFGRVSKTLIDSNEIDLDNNQIISFFDDLSIGPVCDIQEKEKILERKNWLRNIFVETLYFNEILDSVENDLNSINSILANADKIDKIFLWTGFYASEIASTARLITHLSNLGKSIFIVNYPNIPVESVHGDIIFPKALVQTAPFQIKEIVKHFKLIDSEGINDWINLWDKFKLENSQLRIIEQSGQITVKNSDYIDSYLLSNCEEIYQKSALIIGKALIDIDFDVDDNYLNWRLNQLASDGKVDIKGNSIEIRDYEVRKMVSANF